MVGLLGLGKELLVVALVEEGRLSPAAIRMTADIGASGSREFGGMIICEEDEEGAGMKDPGINGIPLEIEKDCLLPLLEPLVPAALDCKAGFMYLLISDLGCGCVCCEDDEEEEEGIAVGGARSDGDVFITVDAKFCCCFDWCCCC